MNEFVDVTGSGLSMVSINELIGSIEPYFEGSFWNIFRLGNDTLFSSTCLF